MIFQRVAVVGMGVEVNYTFGTLGGKWQWLWLSYDSIEE